MRLLTCEKYDLNSIFHLFNYIMFKQITEFSEIEVGNLIPFKDLKNNLKIIIII
jgi:hypothetical protein